MGVPVVNAASPQVRIVAPRDGAVVPAGRDVVVRAESRGSDELSMLVNGAETWSGALTVLQGSWAPEAGRHRIVAVAVREGAPDAVAHVDILAVPPDAAAPAPAGPAAPEAGAPGAPAPPPAPAFAGPGAGGDPPAPARRGPGGGEPAPRPSERPQPPASPAPASGGAAEAAGPAPRRERRRGGPVAALARLLSDPERVAWTVAFPLLLIVAAAAYALVQRFIDGGQKLAWRGRGRADDQVIEF